MKSRDEEHNIAHRSAGETWGWDKEVVNVRRREDVVNGEDSLKFESEVTRDRHCGDHDYIQSIQLTLTCTGFFV